MASICPECKNDIWEIDREAQTATCTNCFYVRPYYTRRPQEGNTPSQDRAVAKIRRYFQALSRDGQLAADETETQNGLLFYRCQTTGNVYSQAGFFAQIGRRGKITILSVYDLGAVSDPTIGERYAAALGAHVKN